MGKYKTFMRSNSSNSCENAVRVKSIVRFARLTCWSCTFALLSTFDFTLSAPLAGSESELHTHSEIRNADGGSNNNCTIPGASNFPDDLFSLEARQHGAVAIHFVAVVYVFYALLILCEDYLVPAVESICRELQVSSDVAGATFMACSSSAPELFTNLIATFITKSDVGVGSIMGSTVFNILCVASFCGITSKYTIEKLKSPDGRLGIPLEWWPLTRDSLFYILAVAGLIITLFDRKVHWYEALALILLYCVYILALWKNATVKYYAENWICWLKNLFTEPQMKRHRNRITIMAPKPGEATPLLGKIGNGSAALENSGELSLSLSSCDLNDLLISKALLRSSTYCIETIDCGPWTLPKGRPWTAVLEWTISWPVQAVYAITIPDCRKHDLLRWYPLTLIMSVAWIAVLTYVVTWMLTVIGVTLSIPDSVMGMTFLAAGTSIPEVFSSIIVARQGLGSMALSNSMGSNTFDILFCLGTPWLIKTIILMLTQGTSYIQIQSGTLEYSAMLIIAIVIIFYTVLVANRFLLDLKVGLITLLMYIAFIVIAVLLEMNVFFPVNLPPCKI